HGSGRQRAGVPAAPRGARASGRGGGTMSEGGYRTGPAHRGPSAIRLVWVYPDLLSTYGDRGNLLVLARRARLHGFGVEIAEVNSDQRLPVDGGIFRLGGRGERPQILAAPRRAAWGP